MQLPVWLSRMLGWFVKITEKGLGNLKNQGPELFFGFRDMRAESAHSLEYRLSDALASHARQTRMAKGCAFCPTRSRPSSTWEAELNLCASGSGVCPCL